MSIHFNVPMSEYLMMDAFSSGVACKVISQSPRHALHSRIVPRDPSSASNKGEIAHRILLEGNEDDIVLVEADNWRTKESQKLRDQAYVDGKVPILYREMGPIRTMVTTAKHYIEQTEIAGVFETGNPEVTVTWDDDGLPCKARPDYLSDLWHVSVKTTNASADPVSWVRRQLTPMGYDFGISFYRRGLLANGIDVEHRILVIEQNPPYGCCLVALTPQMAAIADADVERSINIWRECQRKNEYPGYDTRTHWAEPTPWALAAAEERELEIFETVGA